MGVIDETVDGFYGEKVRNYFAARGVAHEILRLPLVEENKSVEMMLKVCEKMKKFNIDRRTEPVIAIGGGVCLDVVGLAASLFRRRTPYIRVPTTSLAYVDASVGAKNGCNFAGSKNRLGTYVAPAAALLDSSFFKTQEGREVSNGLAEMAKMSLMKSKELFHLLKDHAPRLVETRFEPRDATDDAPERVLRLSIETMLEELAPNLWEHSLGSPRRLWPRHRAESGDGGPRHRARTHARGGGRCRHGLHERARQCLRQDHGRGARFHPVHAA